MRRGLAGPQEDLMSRTTSVRRASHPAVGRRAGAVVTIVVSASLVVGGCGIGSIGKVITAVHALADAVRSLRSLQSEIQKGEKVSYEATYQPTGGGGSSAPVTFAEGPGGRYAFMAPATGGSGATDFVADGKNQYECSHAGSGTQWTCLQSPEPQGSSGYDSDEFWAFTGTYVYGVVEALQVEAAIAGFKVTNSTMSVNGIPLKCVAITGKVNGQVENYKWCITGDGILGLVGYGGANAGDNSSFEITQLNMSPPASIFEPPPGASFTTLTTSTT
jgi:hypothetical protein